MRLCPPGAAKIDEWIAVRHRNKNYLQPFEPLWPKECLSREFLLRRLIRQSVDWKAGRNYSFLILEKENGMLIGGININNVCRGAAQYASLGYWIDEACQGQGLMTEALSLAVDFCAQDLKLHRLNAACLPHNERSINVLLRSGFEEEGFARRYIRINGIWEDHVLFGLTLEPSE